jgi:hypothetical protein
MEWGKVRHSSRNCLASVRLKAAMAICSSSAWSLTYGPQTPLVHDSCSSQALPQAPQLASSDSRSTQTLEQHS